MGTPYQDGLLEQSTPAKSGANYVVSLWLANTGDVYHYPSELTVPVRFTSQAKGVWLYSAANAFAFLWTRFSINVRAPVSIAPMHLTLSICGAHDFGEWGADDVSVTIYVPTPCSDAVAYGQGSGLVANGSFECAQFSYCDAPLGGSLSDFKATVSFTGVSSAVVVVASNNSPAFGWSRYSAQVQAPTSSAPICLTLTFAARNDPGF